MFHKLLLFGQKWIESGTLTGLLSPLSWGWAAVCHARNWLYDRGFLPVYDAGRPVVSIGNITAGGTGKTPLVLLLAERFSHRKVAILCREYGKVPDEARLLRRRLPKAAVYVGKDRALLAQKAVAEGAELLILDDGFQHRKLRRDFEFVVLDPEDPLGKGHFLPLGFLRDAPQRLRQADALFIQGVIQGNQRNQGNEPRLQPIVLKKKVAQILDEREEPLSSSSLCGKRVGLFCAIAKPSRFKKTVEGLGAEIASEWALADHEPIDLHRLKRFSENCNRLGINYLVCTEKDFVKLPEKRTGLLPILFLEMELEVVRKGEEWEKWIEKIDRKIDNNSAYER